ncbi:small nuclear ribonucleoprotein 35kDa (U11 U12) [Phytophthora boehmeriae]|uniref:Small nuclear ribonucleoprotein 35kDa (U11 U12) n=1 Tax=Phytophthora boehmeriae TaxID=109152 RepID=A0A8T1X6K7_9STRA|nr:small nuclear ribonucleoprotein 35kDa (U11 U12) [Phytophthora boehmeriae]
MAGDKRRRSRSRDRRDSKRSSARSQPSFASRNAGTSGRRHWFAEEYDPVQIGSIDGTDTTPHDKGLVRAQKARFDPKTDPQIQGDPFATLFVGRLHFDTTEDTLRSFFGAYGPIRRLRLVRDKATQKSKGYAFVEFADERDFERAYRQTHRRVIDGATILVDFERSRVMKGWKPRRLGGGLGGRKESGQLRFGGRDRPFRAPMGGRR